MQTVLVFIGTRPEGIKLAPVVHALAETPGLRPRVVITGQHKGLLEPVLTRFDIPVHYDLAVMRPGQGLNKLAGRLLCAIDEVLLAEKPAYALIQGDTTTVLTAGLACFHRGVPFGHVEAGLRTGDLQRPFPEEANRRLVAPLADLHFAPTQRSRDHLLAEGTPPDRVHVTGNTAIDALRWELNRLGGPEGDAVRAELADLLGTGWWQARTVLITAHRRENLGVGLESICQAVTRLALRFPATRFIFPVHLNPAVQSVVHQRLGQLENVALLEPQPYPTFVALMAASSLILTDSGGVQEEAPSLGKPVLVLRETTERPEGLFAGTVELVGTDPGRIVRTASHLLTDPVAYRRMAHAANPYGDGHAAPRVAHAVAVRLGVQQSAAVGGAG